MSAAKGWSDFERAAPDFASAARRLFVGEDGVAIGFLATASAGGNPHLGPVCPIFCADHLYLSAGARTPKVRDLRGNPRFALHAFLAANDEELQLRGPVLEITGEAERSAVHEAIPFAAFDRDDPIFRLDVSSSVWVYWENAGQPDTRPVRRRWSATGSGVST